MITIGKSPVVTAIMTMPITGAWHMDAVVSNSVATGKTTLSLGVADFACTVLRAGVHGDITYIRAVGGSGGLSNQATPKFYANTPAQTILTDLLSAQDEALSASSSKTALAQAFLSWTVVGRSTGAMIGALVDALPDDTSWRVVPDGTVWIGADEWPVTEADVVVKEDRFEQGMMMVESELPLLWPGTALPDGRRVSYVESSIAARKVSSIVYLEDAP